MNLPLAVCVSDARLGSRSRGAGGGGAGGKGSSKDVSLVRSRKERERGTWTRRLVIYTESRKKRYGNEMMMRGKEREQREQKHGHQGIDLGTHFRGEHVFLPPSFRCVCECESMCVSERDSR